MESMETNKIVVKEETNAENVCILNATNQTDFGGNVQFSSIDIEGDVSIPNSISRVFQEDVTEETSTNDNDRNNRIEMIQEYPTRSKVWLGDVHNESTFIKDEKSAAITPTKHRSSKFLTSSDDDKEENHSEPMSVETIKKEIVDNYEENIIDPGEYLSVYEFNEVGKVLINESNVDAFADDRPRKRYRSFERFDPILELNLGNLGFTQRKTIATKSEDDNDDSDPNRLCKMSKFLNFLSKEQLSKNRVCYQEFALPDNIKLGIRISRLTKEYGCRVEPQVTTLLDIALKNFIRNILTELFRSKTSFRLLNNRFIYDIGEESYNPYVRNHLRLLQDEIHPTVRSSSESYSTLLNRCEEIQNYRFTNLYPIFGTNKIINNCKYIPTSIPKRSLRSLINKNQLTFDCNDQIDLLDDFDEDHRSDSSETKWIIRRKNRSISNYLLDRDNEDHQRLQNNTNCNLYHLLDLLIHHRSLIPVTKVWSKTLFHTIASFNNLADWEK
ncbi:Zinc transporter 2 [Sarcoptes scabiei]|uniref:Uncharacterized protein n=1 Tax=Sarcoptes scabiei TaxID=52283 RepID=A0A834RBD2_SARSC|nr:Zinc transporter 2 [Sarcoptes scabiei]